MNIFFDIETLPIQNEALKAEFLQEHNDSLPDLLAAVKAPGNYRDAAKIAEFCEAERAKITEGHGAAFEDWFLKTSFDGGLGEICCIGVAVDDCVPHTYYLGDEREVLENFFCELIDAYSPMNRPVFIGHNSNAFDIPFIWKRCIILGIKPPIWFPRDPKPWGDSTFDTMIAWNGVGARAGGSMDRICKLLGIPGKSGMDGSQVWPFYQQGRIEEIAAYCRDDVARTRAMFQRMTFAKSAQPAKVVKAPSAPLLAPKTESVASIPVPPPALVAESVRIVTEETLDQRISRLSLDLQYHEMADGPAYDKASRNACYDELQAAYKERKAQVAAAVVAEVPTLKLGAICERFGFTVSAAFLESVGFPPAATDKNSKLYRESDWNSICDAVSARVLSKKVGK